jgi:hypothetical protein
MLTVYQLQMLFNAAWEENCALERVHKKESAASFNP